MKGKPRKIRLWDQQMEPSSESREGGERARCDNKQQHGEVAKVVPGPLSRF